MISQISNKVVNICKKIFKDKFTEDIEIEVDYWTQVVVFNLLILIPLIIVGYFTNTSLQMLIIGIVINLGYEKDASAHMPSLDYCVLFTVPIVILSALLAKFNIHPLLTVITFLIFLKDIHIKSKITMLLLCVCAFISDSISSALFVGILLTIVTSYSKIGKELMFNIIKILTRE